MNFLIADTFTSSLARLTGEEQKAVKTTAFDLQLNPASPGLSFHKLDRAKDKNFWSLRVSSDLRLIVHRTQNSLLLCYVDHHDKAYEWAERRKLETHPKTGAAQLVEVRETVQEILVPVFVESPRARPVQKLLFSHLSDDQLLAYGVPIEWLPDVRQSTDDSLLVLAGHLPGEAAEALLELATGGQPRAPQPVPVSNPFDHPDAQRRFRVMSNLEELERALESPWEKWTVFLHPEQRTWVERDYAGPARVSGSAGTGKTIVALHRAVFLARANPTARVLLTTFTDILANALQAKLFHLVRNQPHLAEQIDVVSIDSVATKLYKANVGTLNLASPDLVLELMREASARVVEHSFSLRFLRSEWDQVVDAWQLNSWELYRDVPRLGRKTRLSEAQRAALWSILDQVRTGLLARGMLTQAGLFQRLTLVLPERSVPVFDFVVVDEAQDLSIGQLRFLAALGAGRANALFFAGDLGQRIFQQPFSWKMLGVDVRGRSRTLRVNYRTSHQIRMQADRLLGPEVSDVDGLTDVRHDTVSVFNGPAPLIQVLEDEAAENRVVTAWLLELPKSGVKPDEIGVFVRSSAQLDRARAAVKAAGLPFVLLDDRVAFRVGHVSISTMHVAKGLEFRAVVVMACDDEVVPLQERIEAVTEDSDLTDVYETERHLLYVACTRARDHLLVTGVEPASEFLDDLKH